MRTSITHPLEIAAIPAGPGMGRIGVTFCPGKKQQNAITGAWDRDLGIDIEAIRRWGAAVVVTLVEPHELEALAVPTLGEAARGAQMEWVHLPIVDVSVPCSRFEREWQLAGEGLRAGLRDGFDVLVHCMGGLGRAGTIAARLLIELGHPTEDAIAAVRKVRPGAIETAGQLAYVRAVEPAPEPLPASEETAIRNRALGALLGLAVGDAVGTTLEFKLRDTYAPLTDMVGGGPFRLAPGQWTDDTAMALALADSLLAHPELDEADLMARFVRWHERGEYSCTGRCFDIGVTTAQALARWKQSGNPVAGSIDPMSAGNGALMRLAPVALRWWRDRTRLHDVAVRQSATTHAAPEALSASAAFAELLAEAIAGRPRSQILAPRAWTWRGSAATPQIATILAGAWRGKDREAIRSSGYVAHSLEAALWCVGRTADFRSAVLTAANLGHDADTTAAITGQLAGALYGLSGIPAEWLARLAWRERIETVGGQLFEASVGAGPSDP